MIILGERLSQERIKKGLTLAEVEKATKIRSSFLSAIEKGEYHKLPSGAYVHGFVRNYVHFLGLPEDELLALFRREYDEEKNFRVLPEGFSARQDFPLRRIKIGQAVKGIFLLFVVLLGYLAFQYRYAVIPPPLDVISPKENAIMTSQVITVEGKTDPNSTVVINTDSVTVSDKGYFKKTITVFSGKSTIAVKAVSKFGKEQIIERHIEVK